ncbi:protein of unknown function [Algoriphagus alkaliphilus]|uniref:TolB-like 6-blade propeller-like n=1 Tax=Algoriphagus alkaliphilus TaxID=279824 RepID=A0A1G5WYM7_9BACT|nr:DUF4221 family protein [Algoriphagus alkaliphilus]SDA62627.1 protein of unknown function [Algoriphagus alkaliphilus]
MLRITCLVLSATFLCSCDDSKKLNFEKEFKDLLFHPENDIEISLNDLSSNFFMLSQEVSISNDEFLVFCNPFPNDPNLIFFYNLVDSAKSFTLDFKSEGPNGVGEMSDFFFHNLDSIFVFDRYSYQMSLVDSSGHVKRKFRLKDSEGIESDENSVIPWMDNKSRAIIRDRFLYIPCYPDSDPYFSSYSGENLLMKLDLISGDFDLLLGYPTKYKSGGFWGGPEHILPSIISSLDGNNLVASFPFEDSIYSVDSESGFFKSQVYVKSDIVSQVNPLPEISLDRKVRTKFQLGNDYYFSISKDQYRQRYYLIANKRYSDDSIDKIMNRESGSPNEQSLIVLNKEFQKIGEYQLPKEFSRYGIFIYKSGVYLLNNENENKLILHNISFPSI